MLQNKFICILILFLIGVKITFAQNIKNKLNIKLGYTNSQISGSNNYESNYSLNPNLIGNSIGSNNFYLGTNYKYNQIININLDITNSFYDSWNYTSSIHNYTSNKFSNLALKPGVQFNTKHKYFGFFNYVKVYTKLAPSFNYINIKGIHSLTITAEDTDLETEVNISEFQFGMDACAGFSVNITKSSAVFFEYGLNMINIKNQIFKEDYIVNQYMNVGLEIKLLKNKRLYY